MAYFGKEFTFEREENFDQLISAVGVAEFLRHKPNQILEKDGDTYKLIIKTVNHEVVFQSGVPFTEVIAGKWESKTTVTVDGDTITMVQDFGSNGVLTSKREYSDNKLKVTITSDKWDGAAHRYYKA